MTSAGKSQNFMIDVHRDRLKISSWLLRYIMFIHDKYSVRKPVCLTIPPQNVSSRERKSLYNPSSKAPIYHLLTNPSQQTICKGLSRQDGHRSRCHSTTMDWHPQPRDVEIWHSIISHIISNGANLPATEKLARAEIRSKWYSRARCMGPTYHDRPV